MVREQADTDAASKIEHMALDLVLTAHRSPDPLHRDRRAGTGTGVNQGEYKLVPSHLSHRVLCAGIPVQTFSDLLQQKVAHRVSRSEERRVGEEGRSRSGPRDFTKN